MKKNILFSLWLVIGINGFAMEKDNEQIANALKDVSEKFSRLRSLISLAEKKDEPMRQFFNLFAKSNKFKQSDEWKNIILDLSMTTFDQENKIVIALTENPNVIVKTEWAHFLCNKEALISLTDFKTAMTEATSKNPQSSILKMKMGDEDFHLAFELMLRMLHNKFDNQMKISPRDYLNFIFLSRHIFSCDKNLLESFIKNNLANIIFSEGQIEASLNDKKFDTYRDIYFFQEHLAYLPSWAVYYFLTTSAFKVDTENSMFFLLIKWAEKKVGVEEQAQVENETESEKKARADKEAFWAQEVRKIIGPMLGHIRWKNISIEYLVTVVKSLVNKYIAPEEYQFAVRSKFVELGLKPEFKDYIPLVQQKLLFSMFNAASEPHQLTYENADKQFAMKVQFRKISEWKNEKYYSQPILSNGYYWYFFMRPEINKETNLSYLAGYLRAVGVGGPEHYISVSSEFSVIKKNKETREFGPSIVEFNHFDRSCGLKFCENALEKITLRSENEAQKIRIMRLETWSDIQKGTSPIVDNDTITVVITIKFQPPNDKKMQALKSLLLEDQKMKETVPVTIEIRFFKEGEEIKN